MSLFPTEAEQIAYIDTAESVNSTPSAFSMFILQDDIDHILRTGGNADEARMKIAAEFSKQKPVEDRAAFLKNLYYGGNGLITENGRFSAWYGDEGIHIANGDAARHLRSAQVIRWTDAAERVEELLDGGTFATNLEVTEALRYERLSIAVAVWNLYHDFSDEAKSRGYLSCLGNIHSTNFPEETERLTDDLLNPEFRERLLAEYKVFLDAYHENRELLRFHFHRPQALLTRMEDLSLPRKEYHSDMAVVPKTGRFITEDEIAASLANGSGFEGGKTRIYEFFQTPHTPKESADFLKKEYGIGGRTHAVSRESGSYEDHGSKGISDQIETGGTTSTLTSDAVVKDIISPQFTLPAGTTAANITVETYACTGKNANDDYTWSNNNSTMGATASISGDQVNVTGFNFSENYVGTVTEGDSVTYRGHKLVISFKVQPKAGFLGGNEVYTNTSAGIYENGSAENPLLTFDRPTVNVPIKDVTVTAKDKNVYLKGEVTADQLKDGSEISVGDVKLDLSKAADTDKPYGLDSWQTEYVDITVTVKDKDGNVISDKLDNLTDDTTYTVEVTVTPKTTGSTGSAGTPATEKSGKNTPAANINVFKPELTFKDSTAYYGESVPANNNYSGNKVGSETWKHGDTASTDAGVTMLGIKPTLDISYTPDESKLEGGKYTKQDVPVSATVKIGTENVNEHTTFVHQDCDPACGWTAPANPGAPAFLIHIQTCTLRITKQGGAGDESYVFDVYKDGKKYSEVTVWGNSTEILVELPIGTYTISENQGWSWRYYANNGSSTELTAQNPTGSITCVNTKNNNQWLNGFSEVVRNIFGTNH